MALIFEIRLQAHQLALLEDFRAWKDGEQDAPFGRSGPHYTLSVRSLLREGLLTFQENPRKKDDRWNITPKGRAALMMFREEVKDTRKTLAQPNFSKADRDMQDRQIESAKDSSK